MPSNQPWPGKGNRKGHAALITHIWARGPLQRAQAMGESEGCGRPEPASEDDQSGPGQSPDLAATTIERELRGLVGVAEKAELRFLGYLLRMALLEAGGVQYRRAQ